jgi:hypothetical protein
MLNKLRNRVTSFLSRNHVCVISTSGSLGAWAEMAQYENDCLALNLRLPRWSDVVYYLEQDPQVMIIIQDAHSDQLCWLQYRGIAQVKESTDDPFIAIHITPTRIDLLDESRVWGERETLDM